MSNQTMKFLQDSQHSFSHRLIAIPQVPSLALPPVMGIERSCFLCFWACIVCSNQWFMNSMKPAYIQHRLFSWYASVQVHFDNACQVQLLMSAHLRNILTHDVLCQCGSYVLWHLCAVKA